MTNEEIKGMKAIFKALRYSRSLLGPRVGRSNVGLTTIDFAMGAIKELLVENGVALDERRNLKL